MFQKVLLGIFLSLIISYQLNAAAMEPVLDLSNPKQVKVVKQIFQAAAIKETAPGAEEIVLNTGKHKITLGILNDGKVTSAAHGGYTVDPAGRAADSGEFASIEELLAHLPALISVPRGRGSKYAAEWTVVKTHDRKIKIYDRSGHHSFVKVGDMISFATITIYEV